MPGRGKVRTESFDEFDYLACHERWRPQNRRIIRKVKRGYRRRERRFLNRNLDW